ncbi:MAG TPA: Rieske 2Fe-2S domain-containing protein, partial [Gemmatimonadales bacterium]|nr:Rieske 2Fe-2S domain-containing protein [Gemmatimonadales bacterium]
GALDPYADPGLPEHLPRPTDVDPAAEKRAERQVAGLFGLSVVFTVLFVVAYFVFQVGDSPSTVMGLGASNAFLGLTLAGALLCIGVGAIQWARKLMSDVEIVEYRHPVSSSDEDREETLAALNLGVEESGIGRRPLIRNSLLGAAGALGLLAIIPLRDLGTLPGDKLYHTVWKKGMRVVQDVDGSPIKPVDMEVGQLVNGEPAVFFENNADGEPEYEGVELNQEKAKAAVIIVRMQPDDIKPAKGRENWGVEGILCFSKICTHVGCPISLWEQQTHHLLCPCHQSTFDLADNGRVIFGPAARSLPQLPLAVDDEGYLVATSDFTEPVGPSFWERG